MARWGAASTLLSGSPSPSRSGVDYSGSSVYAAAVEGVTESRDMGIRLVATEDSWINLRDIRELRSHLADHRRVIRRVRGIKCRCRIGGRLMSRSGMRAVREADVDKGQCCYDLMISYLSGIVGVLGRCEMSIGSWLLRTFHNI
jgi:hypothetical protein